MRISSIRSEEEWPPDVPDGIVLGRRIGGEEALPLRGSAAIWPLESIDLHAMIFGGPGTGRTETAMRIAHEAASKMDGPVFYLDVSGDTDVAERFTAAMHDAGRRVRIFPDEAFDAWRGEPGQLQYRLLKLTGLTEEDFEPSGPPEGDQAGSFPDCTLAEAMLRIAWGNPAGPPSSSEELLARLDYESLLTVYPQAFEGQRPGFDRVVQRFRILFHRFDGAFDGDWAWRDADAAYFRFDPNGFGGAVAPLMANLFLLDCTSSLPERKASGQRSMIFVSGLREETVPARTLYEILGSARVHDAGVVTIWDSPLDIGSEQDCKTLYGAVGGPIVVHAIGHPGGLCDLAGSKRVAEREIVRHYGPGQPRIEQVIHHGQGPKLDRGDFVNLPNGVAWIIQKGRAMKVHIEPAGGSEE